MATPITAPTPNSLPLDKLHQAFLEVLPRLEEHARLWFRYVQCPGRREDFVAEAVALSWKWFLRGAQAGKDLSLVPCALATLAVKAVRSGRRLVGQEKTRDVLSPRAQQRQHFRVEALPCSTRRSIERLYGEPQCQRLLDAFEERLRDNTQTPVVDQVVFRCDFPAWLNRLPHHKRQVAEDLMVGEATGDVARMAGLSAGRVSQLRRELREDWLLFCGDWGFNPAQEAMQ